jgi:hypothetical protein
MVRLCITHRGGLIDHSQANLLLNEHDLPLTIHCSLQSGDSLERCHVIFGTNETWDLEIRVGVPNTLMHI